MNNPDHTSAVHTSAVRPLRVLIVEDEAILAMDLELMFEDLGHVVVAMASSLAEVQQLAPTTRPDLAFVDMQLAEGSNGLQVCANLLSRWSEIIVVFVTGNAAKVPSDFAGGHGLIQKPFSRTGLVASIQYISQGICRPPPTMSRPPDFTASPSLASAWGG